MFNDPDIDTDRLILMSYKLKYDFIRNIYLPYISVNENDVIANDCLSNDLVIKISTQTVSIYNGK